MNVYEDKYLREKVSRIIARQEEGKIVIAMHKDDSGFSLGADDYVSKPFSCAQLVARVRAVLSRTGGTPATAPEQMAWNGLVVDLATRHVSRNGNILALTPTEFKLLVALMRRQGEVLSPEELVKEVWGPQYKEEISFVRRYIWHLRRKVELDSENPQYIHNERGFGYRFG